LSAKFDNPFINENIISSKEFLKIGLENLKEYFEFKNNMRKFNI
jgi:hypothetical protein